MSTISLYLGLVFILLGVLCLSSNFIFLIVRIAQRILGSNSLKIFIFVLFGLLIERIISLPNWSYEFWRFTTVVILGLEMLSIVFSFITPNFFKKIHQIEKINFFTKSIFLILFVTLGLSYLSVSYIGPIDIPKDCKSDDITKVYCVLDNPEDLVLTPDNSFLIVSEFGSLEETIPGQLSLFNLKSKLAAKIKINIIDKEWGEESCNRKEGDLLGPHGIDLIERDDGRHQLAVVNHAIRESIEMFELVYREGWELDWKGCSAPSKENFLNDVSLKDNGNFFVTHMFDRHIDAIDFLMISLFKYNTGYVLEWQKGKGFSKVKGSEGAMPNGIAYDNSNDTLYIAFNLGDEVKSIEARSGKVLAFNNFRGPDNIILKDNFLWVTSLDHEVLDVGLKCGLETAFCNLPFSIHKVDPATMEIKELKAYQNSIFGLVSVALPVKDRIWLGSFQSDRIASIFIN